jgi:hypothetical protein
LVRQTEKSKLNEKQLLINKRIEDVKRVGQKWGYISELSGLWNISHTSVRRFLERHCPDLFPLLNIIIMCLYLKETLISAI